MSNNTGDMVARTRSKVRFRHTPHMFFFSQFIFFFHDGSIVVYEGGSVMSQARSLWRLELARTKWSGGFIMWCHPMRIRHITTGRYLGVNENKELCLV